MLYPNQFKVNETWIAFKIDSPFTVQGEPYDIYLMLDAGSTFAFGYVLSKVPARAPKSQDVADLFIKAYAQKKQWAKKLIIPKSFSAADVFKKQAEQNGFDCTEVPLSDLQAYIGPLNESLAKSLSQSGS